MMNDDARKAEDVARFYLRLTGRRLIINPAQRAAFERADIDMSLFEASERLPAEA